MTQQEINDLVTLKERFHKIGIDVSDVHVEDVIGAWNKLIVKKVIFGEDHPLMESLENEIIDNEKIIEEYRTSGYIIRGLSKYMEKDTLIDALKDRIVKK